MRLKLISSLALCLILICSISIATLADCKCLGLTAITPKKGTNIETISATIYGKNFSKAVKVKLARSGQPDIIGSNVVWKSSSELNCTFDLRGKAVGKWDVWAKNPVGNPATLVQAFTIEYPAPLVTKLSPKQGEVDTQISATITGNYFRKGAKAKLTGNGAEIPIDDLEVLSATEISGEIDLNGAALGDYDLTVTNDDGKSGKLAKAFTVLPKPPPPPPEVAPVLHSIFFDYDKSNIRVDMQAEVEFDASALKNYLQTHPKVYIVLGGHADERGTNEYNIALSTRRAEAVKNYLVGQGIVVELFVIYAYGEDYPAKLGHDESSWWYNRRVDIAVWDNLPTMTEALKKE